MLNDSQRRDREEAIYQAVLRLIAEGADLRALKVQQIADAADIGKGTVYEYFPSKDAILRGLTRHCIENELDRLERTAAGCRTLDALLDSLLDYLCELARDRVGIYRIVAGALGLPHPPDDCRLDPVLAGRLQTLLEDLLRRLQAAGELAPDLTIGYGVYALMAASVSCLVLLAVPPDTPNGQTMPPQTVRQNTRLLLRRALCP